MNRNDKIKALYFSGISLTELAEVYGVSRQRIHQIIVGNDKYTYTPLAKMWKRHTRGHLYPYKPCKYCQDPLPNIKTI